MPSIQAASTILAPSPQRAASPLSALSLTDTAAVPACACRPRRSPPSRVYSDGISIYRTSDPKRHIPQCRDDPPRLLSPIRLTDRRARPSCSSPSCSSPTPKRRRAHLRGPIRHRHCKQPDCPIVRSDLSVFDQLSLISMADQPPVVECLQPWNLASLADIAPQSPERHIHSAKSTGPIRSRKSSLRSAPFPSDVTSGLFSSPELSTSLPNNSPLLELPFARARRLSFGDDRPSTPPPRAPVRLSEIDFRNLMPVTLSDVDGPERRW